MTRQKRSFIIQPLSIGLRTQVQSRSSAEYLKYVHNKLKRLQGPLFQLICNEIIVTLMNGSKLHIFHIDKSTGLWIA